jgi:hypothetical protein
VLASSCFRWLPAGGGSPGSRHRPLISRVRTPTARQGANALRASLTARIRHAVATNHLFPGQMICAIAGVWAGRTRSKTDPQTLAASHTVPSRDRRTSRAAPLNLRSPRDELSLKRCPAIGRRRHGKPRQIAMPELRLSEQGGRRGKVRDFRSRNFPQRFDRYPRRCSSSRSIHSHAVASVAKVLSSLPYWCGRAASHAPGSISVTVGGVRCLAGSSVIYGNRLGVAVQRFCVECVAARRQRCVGFRLLCRSLQPCAVALHSRRAAAAIPRKKCW